MDVLLFGAGFVLGFVLSFLLFLQYKRDVSELKKQTKIEFEHLAQTIFSYQSKELSVSTEKNMSIMLDPLKEKLQTFEKFVSTEMRERFALKQELDKLICLGDQMNSETKSLASALRGDSKVQGNWGELVLERVLEASGLREGEDFETQPSYCDVHGEDRYRPDVLIKLPENKHLVIDSKVSLKSYDLFRSTEEPEAKEKFLSDHLKSMEKHIDDLSRKHYAKLKGLHSPEFVFLFIPIEPSYIAAMQKDPELSMKAWKKNIVLVTSTSLLTNLKTVASIWKLEKQNRNALEIAKEGAKLYDKFVGFLDDFEKIGKTFDIGQKTYADALGKLKDGPGSVFQKIENLRHLGASPTKRIKSDFL